MYHDYFMVMLEIPPTWCEQPKKNPWAPIWLMPMLEVFLTKFLPFTKNTRGSKLSHELGAQTWCSELQLGTWT